MASKQKEAPKKTEKAEKAEPTKTKAIKKAHKSAKLHKSGDNRKKHHTFTKTRFHRKRTLQLSRKPKYVRNEKATVANTKNFDKWALIKHPLSTEKAMKKMEDENTMVFIVDQRANKSQIKEAFSKIHNVKVRSVNTVIRFDFHLTWLMLFV